MTTWTAKVGPLTKAHKQAVRDTIPMRAGLLVGNLGSTLVAYLTGVESRSMPRRWALGEANPRAEAAARLLTAYTAWLAIVWTDGYDVARNWFIGANPWLGDISPAEAIRNGDTRVLGAVQNFIEDGGGA